jgi:class III poly(R)-hydroxyalkanoic acid synthase PhaC subunit
MTEAAALPDQWSVLQQRFQTFNKVMTTKAAIAQTPKETVWTLNKAKLYRYIPVVAPESRHPIPVLLVFALMNRPTILDLRPGHSFIEYMVGRGYDVYLLDWGVPGLEDKDLKFDDYVLDYMTRAIRKVKTLSGSAEFSLLGWCIGASLTTIYASMRPNDGLRNLLLLTAPLDFSKPRALTFARWTDEKYFDVDRVLAAFGNMPGEMIDYGAKALKPIENYISNYLKLWDNLDNARAVESWHAMNTWVTDICPMAGGRLSPAHCGSLSPQPADERRIEDPWRVGESEAAASQSAYSDRGERSHHPALPVRSDPLENLQRRHRNLPCPGRPHRHYGRERRAKNDLAAHRPMAGRSLPVTRTRLTTYKARR